MIEKVNPSHPDKVADRIAGAIVDLAYAKENNPKIAVEVLLGHGVCTLIIESSVKIVGSEAVEIVSRIAGEGLAINLVCVPQDNHLAGNQAGNVRCGDNGIFKGCPLTEEQMAISEMARHIYNLFPHDGKYIMSDDMAIICQSNADKLELIDMYPYAIINPLGDWTGGYNVDAGATNRKLGSDMGDSVTGGGLHGKDLSKADVSINIWCHVKAQETQRVVKAFCAIGDTLVDTTIGKVAYSEMVECARQYINERGGFEKFAEWGLY